MWRAAPSRANTLIRRTNAISVNAAAQACACWSGLGDSEYVKIVIGIDASGLLGSAEMVFAAIEDANSSGAVSPATRAIARIVEVTMPPTAVGSVACTTVYDLLAPRARLASRVDDAVSVEHLVGAAGDVRQHDQREREGTCPAALTVPDDDQREHEDAEDDRRDAGEDVEYHPERYSDRGFRELAEIDRDEDSHRYGHHRGQQHQRHRAHDRVRDAASGCAVDRRGLDEEVEVERRHALQEDAAHDDHEHRHGDQRREQGEALGRLADRTPATEVVPALAEGVPPFWLTSTATATSPPGGPTGRRSLEPTR